VVVRDVCGIVMLISTMLCSVVTAARSTPRALRAKGSTSPQASLLTCLSFKRACSRKTARNARRWQTADASSNCVRRISKSVTCGSTSCARQPGATEVVKVGQPMWVNENNFVVEWRAFTCKLPSQLVPQSASPDNWGPQDIRVTFPGRLW
jgi:hypothetical protein